MFKINGDVFSKETLARKLDISIARLDTTEADVLATCETAIKYNLHGCASEPIFIDLLVEATKGTNVIPISGIAMPRGGDDPKHLLMIAEDYVKRGIKGFDTPLDICMIKDKKWDRALRYLRDLQSICEGACLTNVVCEVDQLTQEEIATAAKIMGEAGVDNYKTSTGSTKRGPLPQDIMTIKANLSGKTGIMAASTGSFWTTQICMAFFVYGATVCSTRNAAAVIDGLDDFEAHYRMLEFV
jgi:deoxyribose-phosphate aldolase